MPNAKPRPAIRPLKGIAITRFVEQRKAALANAGLDTDTLSDAITALDLIVANSAVWELDHKEFPSLPARPTFSHKRDGTACSMIPIPHSQRHLYEGKRQRMRRWSGPGIAA